MTHILQYLNQTVFALEYSLSCLLFMLSLRRRPLFPLRYGLCLFLCLNTNYFGVIWFTQKALTAGSHAFLTVGYIISSLVLSALLTFWACTRLSLWDCLYGAACAFAIQHFSYCVFYCLSVLLSFPRSDNGITEFACFLAVAPLVYLAAARRLPRDGAFGVKPFEALQSCVVIFFFAYYLSYKAEQIVDGTEGNDPLMIIIRIYAMLCCLFVLWAQAGMKQAGIAEAKLEASTRMEKERRTQYELSKASMDLINQKCHDLKHQIGALRNIEEEDKRNRYLQEIEESVLVYDSLMHTGNESLDAILTERSLACEREGIGWTCMADGRKLSFMDPLDLYALLGNALDNAMECARALKDPQKRMICVHIDSKPAMAVIQVENYYEGTLSFSEDGLIQTRKEDTLYHGFGLRSIRDTAEKYGGTVSISLENQVFLLSVLVPVP